MGRVLTNNISMSYAIEDSIGELPVSPEWKLLEPNAVTKFGADIKTVAREPISKLRQRRKGTIVDLDSAVEFNADLTIDAFTDFAEAFVFSEFNGAPSEHADSVTAGNTGTGATFNITAGGSGPFTVTVAAVNAGGSGYAVGDKITIAGSTGDTLCILTVASLSVTAVATVTITDAGSYAVTPAGTGVASKAAAGGYGTSDSSNTILTAGRLVYAQGFSVLANNGLKVVAANGSGRVIKVASLTAETPGNNALVEECGVRGGSGDIQVNSSGNLISSSLDFTTLGLTVGQVIWVGGDATANHAFAQAANRGYARITAIAANLLTLDKKATTFVTDNGSGKTIDLYYGRFLRNVSVDDADYLERSFQFELAYPNLDNPSGDKYEYALGNYANQMTMELPLSNKAVMTFSFIGTDTEPPTSSRATNASTPIEVLKATAFNTSSDIARLRITEVDETGLTTDFKTLKLTLNNNVSPEKVLSVLGARFMNTGNFFVDIEADILFTNSEVVDAIRNNTTVTMDFSIRNENGAIFVDIPSMTLGGGAKDFPVNETVLLKTTAQAFKDDTLDTSLGISLFPYVPAS